MTSGLAEKKDPLCRAELTAAGKAEQGAAADKAELTGAAGQAEQRTAAGLAELMAAEQRAAYL